MKVYDENSRIRIHTKMSWIRNTDYDYYIEMLVRLLQFDWRTFGTSIITLKPSCYFLGKEAEWFFKTFLVTINFTKLKFILFLKRYRKTFWVNWPILSIFYPKLFIKLTEIWIGDPDPGFKRAPNPQHCLYVLTLEDILVESHVRRTAEGYQCLDCGFLSAHLYNTRYDVSKCRPFH